jgi:DNA-binding winged helix-turn-helix (wHTH) protein
VKTCFGPFTLDGDTRQLTRGGCAIHLSPKAFELLAALAAERPNVLSKAVLQQRLWPDTFVAEANLSNLIAEIRAALGDSARTPAYLRTVHKFGYAFCAQASDAAPLSFSKADTRVVAWLEWGAKRFPLAPGAHVIGRDPDVEIRLDASTVSRRHARLVVNGESVVLEDAGSKNGTFRGGERVTTGHVVLTDGDVVRIGSVQIIFRLRANDLTETQQGTAI